ncbi:f3decbc3-5019-46e8-b3ad-4407bd8b343f [Thermothielavioides terrestris]|uniref:F3decbc3-5019-46e8-b3ad-4407bd8b343f n=1 Tax=Thermothielavioides terrestris TaxID=2587410 RepID=A0A446BDZ1_9PEZI|nr:f3decbc3-5019-46e8-b3ad-4407bd8b343f [Thermothielavioides terrestris]
MDIGSNFGIWALFRSLLGLLVLLFELIFISLLALVVYRLWFHPLARIPGPRLAAISNAWQAFYVRNGRSRDLGKTLHQTYGPVVRVGPDEVWFNSAEAFKQIYRAGNGYEKSDFYLATALNKPDLDWRLNVHFPDTLDLLSEFDVRRYRTQRRLIGPLYSTANLLKFEAAVDQVIRRAIAELRSLNGAEVDLKEWMHIVTVECLGAVVLSWSPRYIDNRSDGGTSTQSYLGWKRKSVFGLFPAVTKIAFLSKTVGRAFANIWGVTFKTPKNFKPFFTPVYQKSSKRIASALRESASAPTTKDRRKDLLADLIQLHKDRPEFTETYLRRLAVTNFGAGHETMCSALTATMAMIGSHPGVQDRVSREIRRNPGPPSYDAAVRMRYAQACIKEAQRLHPVISMSLSRKVPAGGLSVHGYFFPAGTTVGCNPVALHVNPDIFGDDAAEYNPDRWLRDDDPAKVRIMERTNLTWGAGARACPGRHLAEMVVYKVIPALLREFDLKITVLPKEEEMPCYFIAMMTGVKASHPVLARQTRNVAAVPGKDPNNMGGPGGQEHLPESNALRRRYAMTTICGIIAASSILLAARMARRSTDPNAGYVLVHDNSKGELDDVKYIKTTDLPKS